MTRRRRNVFIPAGVRDGQELVVDRITRSDGVDLNAVVELRVRRPRGLEPVVRLTASIALLVVVALIVILLVSA